MAALPKVAKTARVVRAFAKAGFVPQGRKGTSHERLKRPGPQGTVTVRHPKMRLGLLKSCIRAAGMTTDEFMELYEKS